MKIGNVALEKNKAFLAPMAGVTDLAFRKTCKDFLAGLTYSEMVSAKALTLNSKKTKSLLEKHESETTFAVQIFGNDPDIMAEGAVIAADLSGADIIDINMGCPTPKIVSNGDGSALMKDPKRAAEIVSAVCNKITIPVTVKMRLGWDKDTINVIEFSKRMQDAGAAMVCVHGRTREQMYSGKADWSLIARVKEALSIPVIANGDVFTEVDALNILDRTGADFVMVGRGCLGNPWLFEKIHCALNGLHLNSEPSVSDRLDTAAVQIELAQKQKGERIALLEARKHFMWYLHGIPGAKQFYEQISKLETLNQMYSLMLLMKEKLRSRG
ncbi:MAG: tRNA dihydrouridine synthase DusB [Clostridiales bacterium]|nr:tRNA dihydrouridine synthase DusB [Clostridiales bacterium]